MMNRLQTSSLGHLLYATIQSMFRFKLNKWAYPESMTDYVVIF